MILHFVLFCLDVSRSTTGSLIQFLFQSAENIATLKKLATRPPTSAPAAQDEKKDAGDEISDDDVPGEVIG